MKLETRFNPFNIKIWILKIKLGRIIRSAAIRPGITVGVFLGAISILATLYYSEGWDLPAWLIVLFLIVLFFFSIYIGGILTKKSLSPMNYSKVVASGRPQEEVLYFLAKKTMEVHKLFNKAIDPIEDLLKRLIKNKPSNYEEDLDDIAIELNNIWNSEKSKNTTRRVIVQIEKFLRKHHKDIQRIECLKVEAAYELGIPKERLCNHILQFTPSLFKNRIIKVGQNLEELSRLLDSNLTNQKMVKVQHVLRRIFGMLKQIEKIKKISDQRIKRQNALMKHLDLHSYIRQIASSKSSSGALFIYTDALSYLAKHSSSILTKWDGDINDKKFKEVEERFMMIFRKQKAYPGYDPHNLLLRLFRHALENSTISSHRQKIEGLLLVLNQFKNFFKDDKTNTRCFLIPQEIIENLKGVSNGNSKLLNTEIRKSINSKLENLKSLSLFTSNYLTESKENLVKVFKKSILPNHFNNKNGFRFIVTHGYSKTTRQIIKGGLVKAEKKQNYIFILEEENSDKSESRLMKFELQRETEFYSQNFNNISIGSIDVLLKLVDFEKDRILFLFGAESFDPNGRVILAKGIGESFIKLKRKVVNKAKVLKILTVVSVEDYKKQEQSITDSEPFDDHFDSIEILEAEDVDLIITDKDYGSIEREQYIKKVIYHKHKGPTVNITTPPLDEIE